MAIGLILFLDDPDPPHPADECFGVFGDSSKSAERITGSSRLESRSAKLRSRVRDLDFVGRVQHGGPADELADGTLAVTGVAAEPPPTVPGIPVRISSPARPDRAECEMRARSAERRNRLR